LKTKESYFFAAIISLFFFLNNSYAANVLLLGDEGSETEVQQGAIPFSCKFKFDYLINFIAIFFVFNHL